MITIPILDESGFDVSAYANLTNGRGQSVVQSYAPRAGSSPIQAVSAVQNAVNALNAGKSNQLSRSSGGSSGGGYYDSGSSGEVVPLELNYPNARMASLYGMDQATAYQEALANTAHQREMEDLRAAGLNPILTATGGRGAAVFGGDVAYPMYGSGGSSSGGVSYGGSGGSGKTSGKSILSNYNVQNAIAAAASGLTMVATKNFSAGATAYYAAKAAFQLFR